ncbi:MAG: type II toxin-antitoxin system RelE/ParE family toxin [Okeania sp. SIO3C4]|nr:type II toxin-antitoxin system RelE/ParE family toxin [Okeania sp. SIO3C4]
MSYNLLLNPKAKIDVVEAAEWYEEQKKGLGYEFFLRFDDALELLKDKPYICQKVYRFFRKALLRKFPYAIFYHIDEQAKEIEVIGVFSTYRDPEIWKQRIKL